MDVQFQPRKTIWSPTNRWLAKGRTLRSHVHVGHLRRSIIGVSVHILGKWVVTVL